MCEQLALFDLSFEAKLAQAVTYIKAQRKAPNASSRKFRKIWKIDGQWMIPGIRRPHTPSGYHTPAVIYLPDWASTRGTSRYNVVLVRKAFLLGRPISKWNNECIEIECPFLKLVGFSKREWEWNYKHPPYAREIAKQREMHIAQKHARDARASLRGIYNV